MVRNSLLIKNVDKFLRLAQQSDDPNDEEQNQEQDDGEDEEVSRAREALERARARAERRKRQQYDEQQQQPRQRRQQQQAQPGQQQGQQQGQQPQQAQQTPYQILVNGLKGEVYDEITASGQTLKGKFNGDLLNTISQIFNKELFYHALVGRGDRDKMREMVSKNRIRLGVTVTANTNSDGNVGLRFWATDPSFRSQFANQTAAVEQQLNQIPRNIIYNAIQTIAQTSGISVATPGPIVINTYFNVVDNNGNVSYTQI